MLARPVPDVRAADALYAFAQRVGPRPRVGLDPKGCRAHLYPADHRLLAVRARRVVGPQEHVGGRVAAARLGVRAVERPDARDDSRQWYCQVEADDRF